MKDQISGEAEESSSPLGTKNAIKDKTALFQRKPKSNNFSAVFDWRGGFLGKGNNVGMKSLWNSAESERWNSNELEQRIYSARLLAQEPDLGCTFGGTVSVKTTEKNLFGEPAELMYVHQSGTSLGHIDFSQFIPLRRDYLLRLLSLPGLSARGLEVQIRLASSQPDSAEPTLDALLHAVIPAKYVDQVSADAILSLTNTPRAAELIQSVFGPSILLIPYFQSNFDLAKAVAEALAARRIKKPAGLILAKRGLCTFGETPEESYRQIVHLVSAAEERIQKSLSPARVTRTTNAGGVVARAELAQLRRRVSELAGKPMILSTHQNEFLPELMARPDAVMLLNRGPASPEHLRCLRRSPLAGRDVQGFVERYRDYFLQQEGNIGELPDLTPRIIIDPALGFLAVGDKPDEADLVATAFQHTAKTILQAEQLGGWQPVSEFDLLRSGFAKIAKTNSERRLAFAGEIALITGAASGIGRATVKAFLGKGAAVAGLDLNPAISAFTDVPAFLGLPSDVTNEKEVAHALSRTVQRFGGIDILVLNTGFLPSARRIVDLELGAWQHAMRVNLDANFNLLRSCYPYLCESPSGGRIIVVSPQNLAPPGKGNAAYAAAKAALTQLVRSAAAEWGMSRIRVQIVHPDNVFDTGIWTPEVLAQRARCRSMTVEEYRRGNFLRTEICSQDVAELVVALCGSAFSKTTGAQIAIDGGSES
jgi:rhamnose utilization protein RhaD (predicted bifunctional aldolase and dehydrogenase)/NAD(P)-dependent dehydrogenase (short-subunit alcohol dehydrogenase family)